MMRTDSSATMRALAMPSGLMTSSSEPMREVIATGEATVSSYISFMLSRPEIDFQTRVIQCSPQRSLNALRRSG